MELVGSSSNARTGWSGLSTTRLIAATSSDSSHGFGKNVAAPMRAEISGADGDPDTRTSGGASGSSAIDLDHVDPAVLDRGQCFAHRTGDEHRMTRGGQGLRPLVTGDRIGLDEKDTAHVQTVPRITGQRGADNRLQC